MEMILAAGIGATATIAGAYISTRPNNKKKRPLARKERKRRRAWLLTTSTITSAMLIVAALPVGLLGDNPPIWAIASLTALLLSLTAPIRAPWAILASLAMLIATMGALPLAAIAAHAPLKPYLHIASLATSSAIAIATLVLVGAINQVRCA